MGQRATVEIDGRRIAYERAGEGPPLVLLHGYVGDGATTWRPQLDGMADAFTVIAWDAPGAGESDDPPESFGVEGFADCAAAFVAALGFDAAHIVGLSFGGVMAIELARRHPEIVTTLTLASAYAGWRGSLAGAAAEERLRQALDLSTRAPDELVDALLPTMFTSEVPAAVERAFAGAIAAFHPVGFRAMARASAGDVRDALATITAPTLLVYGGADVRAPLDVANDLHRSIAGSSLVVLAGVGHVCNIEAPNEFNSAVRSFLLDH